MSLSKLQLAGKLSKKTLSLDEKVKFLDFSKSKPKFRSRKLAENFKIGKTAAANILKEEKSIRSQYELFCESLRNVIGLASTKKSMGFYFCGIRDVVLPIFIQMAQC